MLYWIYDISTVAAVGVFAAVFVGVCWLGTMLVSSQRQCSLFVAETLESRYACHFG